MANKITVTSVGTTANVNATPDSARYYSDKSKEWAIGEKLIDNEDYSSKYYANESKKQANIATAKTTEVIASGNTAVSNIESARDNAITDITNQENLSVDNVNSAGATQVALATEQANIATQQATIATNKASEVVASGNEALSNIDTAKAGVLIDITNLKNTSVSNITTAKNSAITSITTQETISKNNIITTGNEQVERVNLTGVDNRAPIFSKSEVGTNESVYQNIYDLKHSTFDLSKFTVVGSPIITNDGVASGLSGAGDYLLTPSYDISNASSWEIQFKVSNYGGQKYYVISSQNIFGFICDIKNSSLFISTDGTSWKSGVQELTRPTDKNSLYRLKFDGEKYTFDYFDNEWIIMAQLIESTKITNKIEQIRLGGWSDQGIDCSIDLKQFSITVDGVEVFSGNKTGLDVIKPDNYTVVGSPTISDDGIVTPQAKTDRIEKNIRLNSGQNIVAECNFKYKGYNCPIIDFLNYSNSTRYAYLTVGGNGARIAAALNENTLYRIADIPQMVIGRSYKLRFETDLKYYIRAYVNDVKYIDATIQTAQNTNVTVITMGTYENWSSSYYNLGNVVDLNSYKIYVDGNLVYQPCLKIPYTQNKTGSKIVDVAYRDRVIDLYEQEGQAGYYTIDEPNKNFTLPMGEIYGMIGQRSLISSTVTETNRVDIYSDKTCLICGNVSTAGTINLPIELVNNNYFITLSTSAKTATSFTTTATGDYILIGKVA